MSQTPARQRMIAGLTVAVFLILVGGYRAGKDMAKRDNAAPAAVPAPAVSP